MIDDKYVRKFFEERFNRTPESDPNYYRQWWVRLNSDNPGKWMDSETRGVYTRILREMTFEEIKTQNS